MQLYELARYAVPVVCTTALSTTKFTPLATDEALLPEVHKSRALDRHGDQFRTVASSFSGSPLRSLLHVTFLEF